MRNPSAAGVAFATSARSRVLAAAELPVYERAVTPGSSWGEVCPITGDTGLLAGIDQTAGHRSARFVTTDSAMGIVSAMGNDRLSKFRTGYHAISGTG